MTTLEDIATAASVSVPTASKALRGSTDVSAKTRARVVGIAQSLDYRPSEAARALRTGRHSAFSVLLPVEEIAWFEPVLRGICDEADRLGFRVLVHPVRAELVEQALAQSAVRGLPVDGALVIASQIVASTDLSQVKLPVAAIDDVNAQPPWPAVRADSVFGGHEVTRHLIERGCAKIAVIAPKMESWWKAARLEGYRQAHREAGLEVPHRLIIETDEPYSPGATTSQAIEHLLHSGAEFDAVFGLADYLAFSALRTLRRAAIKVPDDVLVAGFDDERAAQFVDPPLTTVRQPFAALGAQAVGLLVDQIEDREAPAGPKDLPVELIVRESTGVIAEGVVA